MDIKKSIQKNDLYITATATIFINLGLMQYIKHNMRGSFEGRFLTDILIILIAVYIGKGTARKLEFPLWWYRNSSISLRQQLTTISLLGLAIIVSNSLIYYFHRNNLASFTWLTFSNTNNLILLALRAALQEEVLFRLFAFPVTAFFISKINPSKKIYICSGIIISSLLFSLMHGGFNITIIIFGSILAYAYYKNGLIPAMLIHFLGDAVPWLIILLMNQ